METIVRLYNKNELRKFLQKNVALYLYHLGDLDDFFWPHTTWYGLRQDNDVNVVVLFFSGEAPPVLLALIENNGIHFMNRLIKSIRKGFPKHFYAHLSQGVEESLTDIYKMTSHSKHYKMTLEDKSLLSQIDTSGIRQLTIDHLDRLKQFYELSYPGNWFNKRMLETGQYFGLFKGSKILSAAGVHVYSTTYRVAALGNIATHPDHRGKGYGKSITAKLCQNLLETTDYIGLNVRTNNSTAIRCYEKLGFKVKCRYEEFMIELKDIA